MYPMLPPEFVQAGRGSDIPRKSSHIRTMINAVFDACRLLNKEVVVRRRGRHRDGALDYANPEHSLHLSERRDRAWLCPME